MSDRRNLYRTAQTKQKNQYPISPTSKGICDGLYRTDPASTVSNVVAGDISGLLTSRDGKAVSCGYNWVECVRSPIMT